MGVRFSGIKIIKGATYLFLILLQFQCFGTITEDHSHFSSVLGRNRNYRVFLPPDYYQSGKRFPVIYWFHGSGGTSSQTTYKSEFEDFVNNNDLIIVNVDGSTASGATWDYSLAFEFDKRTQEGNAALTGMHFSRYFRELAEVIDLQFRTVANRDHRAVSGQSMGGLMAPWVASQNKDLIGSVSLFSPSPDAAMFGSAGKELCFENRELYRSLKGLPVRITIARGDRYCQYYREQKTVWELADLTSFSYNEVDYPDHRAVNIADQFRFHMDEFKKAHPIPQNWHHADPFSQFEVWNYSVNVEREQSAFTILENVTPSGMMVCSRSFLPDGPLIQNEHITIITDTIYSPSEFYILTDFNRSTRKTEVTRIHADQEGRLKISLTGGGHVLGISSKGSGAKLFLIPAGNSEEFYCEEGREHSMDYILINVGTKASGPVNLRAVSPKSFLSFTRETFAHGSIGPGEQVFLNDLFPFRIKKQRYGAPDSDNFMTSISIEISFNDSVQDISKVFVYPVSGTQFISEPSDLLILDGNELLAEYYDNQNHKITVETFSGGSGNGNSIPEPGETIELFVRLPQGLGQEDKNTYHPAYLLNIAESPWLRVNELRYNIKGKEYSGAANLQSRITIDEDTPPGTELKLWLKCESYEFSEEGFNRPIQRHTFDYRYVILKIGSVKR